MRKCIFASKMKFSYGKPGFEHFYLIKMYVKLGLLLAFDNCSVATIELISYSLKIKQNK